LVEEVNKYLKLQDYDPYAVALALRLYVEKQLYNTLSEDKKEAFVNTHKTNEKINFCETNNIEVPIAYQLVSAIHNDADHLKFDERQKKYLEKSVVYKLQNHALYSIISNIFKYEENDLSNDLLN
jgi:hypothetical protein